MADGISGAAKYVGETLLKPVADEVGQMVEAGVQTITGTQKQDPAQKSNNNIDPQKIAQDDAVQKQRAIRNINQFNQQMTQNAALLKQQNEQKAQIDEQKDAQETHKVRQFEFNKEAKSNQQREIDLQRAKTRAERKGSIGG